MNQQQEKTEAELLAEQGVKIRIGNKEYTIKPLKFGTIAYANKYAVELKLNSSENIDDFLPNYDKNIDPLMRFIAVCILGDKWKIKLFTGLLAQRLKWALKPKEALQIVVVILQMYDIANFLYSIRYIKETTITAPRETNLIDGQQ